MVRPALLILSAVLALLAPVAASAQSTLLQAGATTPGHAPMYVGQASTQAVVQDSGPASGGGQGLGLSELLLVARGLGTPPYVGQGTGPFGSNLCSYDAPTTNATGYHYLCLSPNATGGYGLISYGAGGVAGPLDLKFNVNGVVTSLGDLSSSSVAIKQPVELATTGSNITLSGEQTVDGVLTSRSRVLVKDQTDATQNGCYVTASGTWSRCADFSDSGQVVQGTQIRVNQGGVNGGITYQVATDDPITIGTTAINFAFADGGFQQTGADAVVRTIQAARADLKTVADFGVIGYAPVGTDCSVNAGSAPDDTAKLAIAANLGYPVKLVPNTCYKITSAIEITVTGSGLIGDRSSTIYMPAANFNSTTLCSLSNCFTSNAIGLYVHGDLVSPFAQVKNVWLYGFRIVSEVADGRAVGAVAFRNAKNIVGDALEMSGFPVGVGITLDSVTGASYTNDNYIHDFTSNAVWATQPQITGITIDNGRLNNLSSDGVHIQHNTILDITLGPVPLATYGMQTDGINPQAGSFFVITDNKIANVGEGIDTFGSSSVIANNDISNVYLTGLKSCHGASYNLYTGNNVYQAGLYGIQLCGDSTTEPDTAENSYIANRITFLNQNGVFGASITACIRLEGGGNPHLPVGNIFKDNDCDASGGKYGIFAGSDDGTGNSFIGNSIINASIASVSVPANVGTFADLTVSTLTAGVNAATAGVVQIANGSAGGQSVAIQNPSATAAYNFNLPATAGTAGLPLLSGGGAANPMTFGQVAIASAVSGLGTGVATFLGTPLSANLRSAVTDETGTGSLVFAGGNIGAASATSINFGQSSLSNYTEGTCTPALAGSSGVGTFTPSVQVCSYELIGRSVTVRMFVQGTLSGAGGNMTIRGLPIAAASTANDNGICSVAFAGGQTLDTGYTGLSGTITPGDSAVTLRENGAAVTSQTVSVTKFASTITFNLACNYHT